MYKCKQIYGSILCNTFCVKNIIRYWDTGTNAFSI